MQKQLRIENGLLMKSGRPVVPPSLRRYVTEQMHGDGHFGIEKLYEKIVDICPRRINKHIKIIISVIFISIIF